MEHVLPEDVFPYPSFREGQKELAQSVHFACKRGERFVAEAMSGFGKTAAVLAGSISAAADEDLQIIYVCRTKRQVLRVLEELRRFAKRSPLRAASLFSKFDYCLLRQGSFSVSPETFKWFCSFQTSNNLCSYFMNVPFIQEKIESLVDAQTSAPGPISELLKSGRELHACPYEVARLCLARARIVVTTYHYLLDENSRSILTAERPLDKVIAVIDEAHNIREFISGNSTVTLSFSEIHQCVEDARSLYLPRISSAISEICGKAAEFCGRNQGWLVGKRSFVTAIAGAHREDWLQDLVFELSTNAGVAWYSVAMNRNLPASIIKVGSFLSALVSSLESDDVELTKSETALFLTDTRPSKTFVRATEGFRSLILLSATIDPPRLFLRSIGLDRPTTVVHRATADYKFVIRTVIDGGVTTRFKTRTPEMYSRITQKISAVCASAPGGIGVFLPSYAVLEAIREPLLSQMGRTATAQPGRTTLVERPGLSNDESEDIMNKFRSNRRCVLLAVQGGRFSEGEDFPGDEMDASVVVGLPLPPPSPTMYAEYRHVKADQLDQHEAYMVLSLLPALRKAFQSAGRHVREPGKVGMVFFMDSRYLDRRVIDLMPPWLKEDVVKGEFAPEDISSITCEFFARARSR